MASDCWSMDVCNQSAGVSMNAPFEANWRMEDIFPLISAGIITFLDTKMVSGTSTCVCFLYLPTDSGSGPAWTLARRHDRPARHSNCGHDGQRKSVAHMPTASATTANLRYGRMIEAETETAEISN